MGKIKTTFIATVFNEEETILKLLDSIASQAVRLDEVIIVDALSTDKTIEQITNHNSQITNKSQRVRIFKKKGNRAIGRNFAIKKATHEIILCSDAGCVLDKNWVKEIIKPFSKNV